VLNSRGIDVGAAPIEVRCYPGPLREKVRDGSFCVCDVAAGFGKLETNLTGLFKAPEFSINLGLD
jgi:hypothetical protein